MIGRWIQESQEKVLLNTLYNYAGHWKGPACLARDTCLGLSPNSIGHNRHKAATICLLGTMCKGEAHGDFERRIMPADSKLLNSALAICDFSGSRRWDFAKTKTGGWLLVWM